MKKTTKIGLPIAILIAGFLIMQGLISLKKDPPKRAPQVTVKMVETAIVRLQPVESSVLAYGRVASSQPVELVAEVTGRVERGDIPFKAAAQFSRGDLLLKVDDRQARMNVNSAKSDLLAALASVLPEIKVDFPDEYGVWQDYFNSCRFDTAIPPLPETDNERIRLYLSRFKVYSLYYAVSNLEIILEKHYIRAPFNGSIVSTAVQAGSTARTGSILGSIINLDNMEVAIPVETQNIFWIDRSRPVVLTSAEFPGQWNGKISRIASDINTQTQTVDVFVDLERNGSPLLLNDIFVRAAIPGITVDSAFAVPPRAVYEDRFVYLIVDGKLDRREVTPVRREVDRVIVTGGLTDGDTLVVEIMQGVSPGMPAVSRMAATETGSD